MTNFKDRKHAIFLDKDGTLIPDVPFNVDAGKIQLNPGVVEGLEMLKEKGYVFIGISNQSGIAHGYFNEEALQAAIQKVKDLLAAHSIQLHGFYYCPHHPSGIIDAYTKQCDCRKPKPGLLLRAAHDLNVDLSRSWMIGDILNDVEAGHQAGCRCILINNGNETEWLLNDGRTPDYTAENLKEAASLIIKHQRVCMMSH